MLHPALVNLLQSKLRRHAELESALADPALIADDARYRAALREHGNLGKIAARARRLEDLAREIVQAVEMLKDADPELKRMAEEEAKRLQADHARLETEVQDALLAGLEEGPVDRNVILEVRAGTGGNEATLFARDLFRMYSRYAERKSWTVEIMDSSASAVGCLKEVVASISGEGAFAALRY